MTAPKKPSARSTRSKTQLAEELDVVRNKFGAVPDIDPAAAQAAAKRRQEVLGLVGTATTQGVVQHLSGIGLEMQGTLDEVKNLMISTVQELNALTEAKTALEQEIEELHSKEVISASITTMLAEYEAQKQKVTEELAAERAKAAETIRGIEQVEKTLKAELETARTREEEEYQYKLNQARRKIEDDFVAQHERRVKALNESEENLKKNWAEREAALKTQEQEIVSLRGRVEAFPTELETAKKAAEAAIAKSLHGEYGHKIAIMETSHKAALGLADQTIKSLQTKIGDQDLVIRALQDKLDRAESRVETIAKSALDSASGRHALEAAQSTMAITRDSAPSGRKS